MNYLCKSIKDHGGILTFGSDFPVCGLPDGLNVAHNIEAGMTRQEPGNPDTQLGGPSTERLSLEDMIAGYTINAAGQLGISDLTGSIETGKRADLVMLDRNIFESDTYEIHKAKVKLTMMDGKIVYRRNIIYWIIERLVDMGFLI